MTDNPADEKVQDLETETTSDDQWETEAGGELEADGKAEKEVIEEPAGETEEKKAERDAAYQTKYQDGLSVLDEIDPTGGLSEAFKSGQVPPPQRAELHPDLAGEGITVGDLSPQQFADMQRQLNAESSATLRAQIQQETAQNDQRKALSASQHRCVKALSIATENADPLNNLNPAVLQQLSSMGITPEQTWPDHFARAYIRELQVSKGLATQGNAIAESAAAKVKATQELAQPGAVAPLEQRPLTKNEELLKKMNATVGGQANKDVFG